MNQVYNNLSTKLSSNQWLSDETIYLAQVLLHKKLPLTNRFENATPGNSKQFSVQKNNFIQIIHDNNHWVIIYSDSAAEKFIIYLCDLLQKSELSKNLSRLVCCIRHSSESEIKIISKPMQQQLNGFDCGVYAIAYATDLAFDRDPPSLSYNRQEMRKHRLGCLQRDDLEPFPNSSKRAKRGKSITHRVQLYCHFRMPFFNADPDVDKGLFTATCAACNEWFHKKCENINALVFKDEEKLKNGFVETVKKFFDDSLKNVWRSK